MLVFSLILSVVVVVVVVVVGISRRILGFELPSLFFLP